MGLVNNALFIGRSALLTYQSALQVVGNNITNAANPQYVRQNAVLGPIAGGRLPEGWQAGNGVQLHELQRRVDNALESRLRTALGDRSSVSIERETMARIEAIVNELSDTDLSTRLSEFFGAFGELQADPSSIAKRQNVVLAANNLTAELQRQRRETTLLTDEINARIIDQAAEANRLAAEIARLNIDIAESEAALPGSAHAMRDRRDALLRDLSEIVHITTREQPNGVVNVYAGNDMLIHYGTSRGFATTTTVEGGIQRVNLVFGDDSSQIELRGGSILGLITSREQHVTSHVSGLDEMSAALIHELNVVHSGGRGLVGYQAVTGTYLVSDPSLSLADPNNGLVWPVVNGSFQLKVRDASGTETTTEIRVRVGVGGSPDTTVNDLLAALDAVPNVDASLTPDGRLRITALNGATFSFAEDTSQVLAALGVNTFFGGRDASDIAVNATTAADVRLIAASLDGTPGDGSNAGALAGLGSTASSRLGGRTIMEYYIAHSSQVAVTSAAAGAAYDASEVIVGSLNAQRESLSGVSLDEEAVQLLKFERAFQAAARYVTVVDGLINEMLNLAR